MFVFRRCRASVSKTLVEYVDPKIGPNCPPPGPEFVKKNCNWDCNITLSHYAFFLVVSVCHLSLCECRFLPKLYRATVSDPMHSHIKITNVHPGKNIWMEPLKNLILFWCCSHSQWICCNRPKLKTSRNIIVLEHDGIQAALWQKAQAVVLKTVQSGCLTMTGDDI